MGIIKKEEKKEEFIENICLLFSKQCTFTIFIYITSHFTPGCPLSVSVAPVLGVLPPAECYEASSVWTSVAPVVGKDSLIKKVH